MDLNSSVSNQLSAVVYSLLTQRLLSSYRIWIETHNFGTPHCLVLLCFALLPVKINSYYGEILAKD